MAKSSVKPKKPGFKKSSSNSGSSSSKITKSSKQQQQPTSKKLQIAKGKSSKVLIERMNRETTSEDINQIALFALGRKDNLSNEGCTKSSSSKKAFDDLRDDHKLDQKTLEKVKQVQEEVDNDIASQLELISGFSL